MSGSPGFAAWPAAAGPGEVAATGNLVLAVAIAVLAGLVSFASPCVLPLVPGFLGYVTGSAATSVEDRRRSRTLLGAALFVAGFSVVFLAATLLASAVGAVLVEHRFLVARLGGAVVIVLGLVFLGLGGQRTVQPRWRPAAGLAGAPVLGMVFAVGWTPCMGPTLGAILALAGNLAGDGGQIARGALLGAGYCLGLGVPFLLIAAGWSRASRASGWLRRHHRGLQLLGGGLLVLVGLLLLTGWWDVLVVELQRRLVSSVELLL